MSGSGSPVAALCRDLARERKHDAVFAMRPGDVRARLRALLHARHARVRDLFDLCRRPGPRRQSASPASPTASPACAATLTLAQVRAGVERLGVPLSLREVSALFDTIDEDGDGTIGYRELHDAVMRDEALLLSPPRHAQRPRAQTAGRRSPHSKLQSLFSTMPTMPVPTRPATSAAASPHSNTSRLRLRGPRRRPRRKNIRAIPTSPSRGEQLRSESRISTAFDAEVHECDAMVARLTGRVERELEEWSEFWSQEYAVSAVNIQRVVRGVHGRARCLRIRRREAAVAAQKTVRKWQAASRFAQVLSALRIQTQFRRASATRFVAWTRATKNAASTTIQSGVRRWWAVVYRNHLLREREATVAIIVQDHERRHCAAVIQRQWRRHVSRRKVYRFRVVVQAVLVGLFDQRGPGRFNDRETSVEEELDEALLEFRARNPKRWHKKWRDGKPCERAEENRKRRRLDKLYRDSSPAAVTPSETVSSRRSAAAARREETEALIASCLDPSLWAPIEADELHRLHQFRQEKARKRREIEAAKWEDPEAKLHHRVRDPAHPDQRHEHHKRTAPVHRRTSTGNTPRPTLTAVLEKRTHDTLYQGTLVEYLVRWRGAAGTTCWVPRSLLLAEGEFSAACRRLVQAHEEQEQAQEARVSLMLLHQAATEILRIVRGFLGRTRLVRAQEAALLIQTTYRRGKGKLEERRQRLLAARYARNVAREQAELHAQEAAARERGDGAAWETRKRTEAGKSVVGGEIGATIQDLCLGLQSLPDDDEAGSFPVPGGWRCCEKNCRYLNEAEFMRCELCFQKRPPENLQELTQVHLKKKDPKEKDAEEDEEEDEETDEAADEKEGGKGGGGLVEQAENKVKVEQEQRRKKGKDAQRKVAMRVARLKGVSALKPRRGRRRR